MFEIKEYWWKLFTIVWTRFNVLSNRKSYRKELSFQWIKFLIEINVVWFGFSDYIWIVVGCPSDVEESPIRCLPYLWRLRHRGACQLSSGHMTRKMWDLIPVLDCSQLFRVCPSQCKPSVWPSTTPDLRVDSHQRTMSGKKHRAFVDTQPPYWHRTRRPEHRSGPAARTRTLLHNISKSKHSYCLQCSFYMDREGAKCLNNRAVRECYGRLGRDVFDLMSCCSRLDQSEAAHRQHHFRSNLSKLKRARLK